MYNLFHNKTHHIFATKIDCAVIFHNKIYYIFAQNVVNLNSPATESESYNKKRINIYELIN